MKVPVTCERRSNYGKPGRNDSARCCSAPGVFEVVLLAFLFTFACALMTSGCGDTTPDKAIEDYAAARGVDVSDFVFKGSAESAVDPGWIVYGYQRYEGTGRLFFLLSDNDGNWTVVAHGEHFDPGEYGAPDDLRLENVGRNPPCP